MLLLQPVFILWKCPGRVTLWRENCISFSFFEATLSCHRQPRCESMVFAYIGPFRWQFVRDGQPGFILWKCPGRVTLWRENCISFSFFEATLSCHRARCTPTVPRASRQDLILTPFPFSCVCCENWLANGPPAIFILDCPLGTSSRSERLR